MRVTSLFSIIGLIYAIVVIIIECPWYYQHYIDYIYNKDDPKTHINWFDFSAGFDSNLNFFRGSATVFFAYTCHVGAFPVYKTLKNNQQRRINKVFQRSILLDFVVYVIVGICGYLTQPINTPDLIINRDNILTNDFAMILARLVMAINLVLSTPANFNAFRLSILGIVWDTDEVTNKK
jgi:amino acid permease